MPVTVLRPSLHELADILEQIFFIACTENLHPRPEELDAAAVDYQAANGLTYSAMCRELRQYGASREIHERAQVIALMRLYRVRWRVWDPEGRRCSGPSRQPKPALVKSPPKRKGRPPKRSLASTGEEPATSNPAGVLP